MMANIPQNITAEQHILGGLIRSGDPPPHNLHPEDFFDSKNRVIYAEVKALHEAGMPVDLVLLSERLKGVGKLRAVGGGSYLVDLYDLSVAPKNIGHYAGIVIDMAARRRGIALANKIQHAATDPATKNPAAIQEILTDTDLLGRRRAGSAVHVGDVVPGVMALYERAKEDPGSVSGILCGLPRLE